MHTHAYAMHVTFNIVSLDFAFVYLHTYVNNYRQYLSADVTFYTL